MTKDEALMLAMEAMEITGGFDVEINAIKEALAQPEQKPVAWIYEDELPEGYPYDEMFENSRVIEGVRMFPVNVAPQRTWVGLTDEELEVLNDCGDTDSYQFAKAIEAKLRSKNT